MRYHNITQDDMNNGDGLRVVLWVAGCEHHCKGCQNPVTWNPDDGLVFDKRAFNEIMKALEKPYVAGITFSGGDPLHPQNRGAVFSIMKAVQKRFPKKTIWVYTGYTWEQILANKYLLAAVTGCELLPRYGQGYYMTPEGCRLYNIPMYETETPDIIEYWRKQKPRIVWNR